MERKKNLAQRIEKETNERKKKKNQIEEREKRKKARMEENLQVDIGYS